MPINAASMTFVRFELTDQPQEFWDDFNAKVTSSVFALTEDAVSSGVVSWDDPFRTDFSYSSYKKGEYIALQFRVDERKVPPIVKRQYMAKEVERFKEENGGRSPSREMKREMSENADAILLRRAFPIPTFCELVWAPRQNTLYVGATSNRMLDRVIEFLEDKFEMMPLPILHIELAKKVLIGTDGYDTYLNDLMTSGLGAWLGYEFLTWLWYSIDTDTLGPVHLHGKNIVAGVLDKMTLSLPEDDKEKVMVVTSDPNSLREARIALYQGKKVSEISLVMTVGESDYILTLDKNVWGIKGVKPPKTENDSDDPDGKFFEKMFFVEEVCAAIDMLYKKFIMNRLDPNVWDEMSTEQSEWVQRSTHF